MNLKEIKEIVDLITAKGISEFELERAGVRLKITRAESLSSEARPQPAVQATVPPPKPAVPLASVSTPAAAEAAASDSHIIRSPMVGTFYSSPSPGDPSFVQTGDRVQPGQVICIIEAMKLMNEIEADTAGEILTCFVENGQPVEYGEPLFELRKAMPSQRKS